MRLARGSSKRNARPPLALIDAAHGNPSRTWNKNAGRSRFSLVRRDLATEVDTLITDRRQGTAGHSLSAGLARPPR